MLEIIAGLSGDSATVFVYLNCSVAMHHSNTVVSCIPPYENTQTGNGEASAGKHNPPARRSGPNRVGVRRVHVTAVPADGCEPCLETPSFETN